VRGDALLSRVIAFLFSSGMLVFYMLGGALRSAGDARTPMILGIVMTALKLALNVILIRGLGPIPPFGAAGSAMGTMIASGLVAAGAVVKPWPWGAGRVGRVVPAREGLRSGLEHHQVAFPIWPANRHSGNRDEHRRSVHASVHRFACSERGRAGGVRRLVLTTLFADHVDIGRADGR